ncbi:MAG: ABC transporter ATP-binding protein [Lachnospiraceae bacterium]|nr:ABC transporter ATP-binding protein [Lachnospiraceae bacterium]
MLYIDRLYKNYGTHQAVKGLSLHIPKGDLFGFVGPNGAGKTTTIRIVCGLLKETSGQVIIDGMSLKKQPNEVKRCIGYVPDFFGVYDNFRVSEYMEFYASLYNISAKEAAALTTDLLELVNLSDKRDEYVDSLSRGMKQRLCVARALLHDPRLLVLDEPSSGLDPRARVEMKELLMNLRSMGKTIIISSHILSELSEMCTSIGIMDQGRLVAVGKIEDILQTGKDNSSVILEITKDRERAISIIRQMADIEVESVMEHQIKIRHPGDDEKMNRFLIELLQQGVVLDGYHRQQDNLEQMFMQLTGNSGESGN